MYIGRKLFPDQNQIYRIRSVVNNIIDEVSVRTGKKVSQTDFVKILNDRLEQLGYGECVLNLATVNRLSLFGKHSASANSLKLLESLPLLHVVSDKYTEDDLKRIALGQPLSSKDEVIISRKDLHSLRESLAKAMAMIDSLTGDELMLTYQYDVDMDSERKQYIFRQILNHKDNYFNVIKCGLLTEAEINEYMDSEIPDHVLISLMASFPIPGPVVLMIQQASGEHKSYAE